MLRNNRYLASLITVKLKKELNFKLNFFRCDSDSLSNARFCRCSMPIPINRPITTPNCHLARAARVVCAQPGTVVCSKTPLSLVVAGGGGRRYGIC